MGDIQTGELYSVALNPDSNRIIGGLQDVGVALAAALSIHNGPPSPPAMAA